MVQVIYITIGINVNINTSPVPYLNICLSPYTNTILTSLILSGTPAVHPNASMLGHNPIGSPLSHQGVALHADPRAMSLPYAGASLEPKPASAYLDRSLAQAQQLAAMNAAMAYPYPGMVPPTLGGVPLTPAQQMFADVQARRLEVSGAQLPVLLNRVEGPNEMAEELGRMAQEGVQETLRYDGNGNSYSDS